MSKPSMFARFILPGIAVAVIPAVILFLTDWPTGTFQGAGFHSVRIFVGMLLIFGGSDILYLTICTASKFDMGSLFPWGLSRKLVVRGIYRHVRNPIILGISFGLAGEVVVFQSWWLLAWTTFFIMSNLIYVPLFEEPRLEKRFGEDYRVYKGNVRRWIPHYKAWESSESD